MLKFLDRSCIAMLKRQFRLKTKDIKFVAFKGKKFSSEFFDIRVISDESLDNPVMTISISVKVSKRAVVRNRIKRLFREAFSQLMKEEKLNKAKYLVVAKNAALEEMKSQDVKKLISETLSI
jgi:ribonuclease P protein component